MNGSLKFPGDLLTAFDRLQRHLDQVLPSANGPANIRAMAHGTFPAINIGITPESIEVVAFTPGIDPKALQLSIDKGLLIIEGERASDLPDGNRSVSIYANERFTGPFRRVFSLPEDADPGQVNASYRDGFLRVSIGKRESSKPRQIQVN